MADTYFEYTLSQCRSQIIKGVCAVASTRNELLKMSEEVFADCSNIVSNWRLFDAVKVCFSRRRIINPNSLSKDALIVYNRCKEKVFSGERFDYDEWFDLLVEANWLFASIQSASRMGDVFLLSDPVEIRDNIKYFFHERYKAAVADHNEYVYIDEALLARKKLFYTFQYERSKDYCSSEYTSSDLTAMKNEYQSECIRKISLFYGLTATAALADDFRRFGR